MRCVQEHHSIKCEMKGIHRTPQPREVSGRLQDVHKGVMEIVNCSGSAHCPLEKREASNIPKSLQ
jgi:hypothetical protein